MSFSSFGIDLYSFECVGVVGKDASLRSKKDTIPERIKEDLIIGFGIDERVIFAKSTEEIGSSIFKIGLDEKLNQLAKRLENEKATFAQYSKYNNLFLVSGMNLHVWGRSLLTLEHYD